MKQKISKIYYYIRYRLIDDIGNFLNPKQKWLTRKIPNSWCDKPELIKTLLFECLLNYVEEEKGLEGDYDWSEEVAKGYVSQKFADTKKRVHDELMEAYTYIKTTRPILEEEIEKTTPPYNDDWLEPGESREIEVGGIKMTLIDQKVKFTKEDEKAYKKIYKIEQKISKLDLKYMQIIVKNHEYMWT